MSWMRVSTMLNVALLTYPNLFLWLSCHMKSIHWTQPPHPLSKSIFIITFSPASLKNTYYRMHRSPFVYIFFQASSGRETFKTKSKGFCCSCNLFFLPSLFFIHLCHDHGIVSMSAPQPDQLLHGLPVYLEILLHCLEAAPGVCPRLLVSKPAVTPGDHGLAPCLPQHRGPLRVTWGKL